MSGPWLKFYPSDWRADPALRICSIGARGMWMEMLCIMHEAEPRGSLLINGRQITVRQLAGLVGISPEEAGGYLKELEGAGVFSRDGSGTIYSRRIRRDEEKAKRDKAHGRKGGNPSLMGVNPPDNPTLDMGDKAQKPEARSQKPEEEPSSLRSDDARAASRAVDAEFESQFWLIYPHKVQKAAALKAFRAARRKTDLPTILAGVKRYVETKPPDRNWRNPATFLNGEGWSDQPAEAVPQRAQSPPDRPKGLAARLAERTRPQALRRP